MVSLNSNKFNSDSVVDVSVFNLFPFGKINYVIVLKVPKIQLTKSEFVHTAVQSASIKVYKKCTCFQSLKAKWWKGIKTQQMKILK